MPDLETVLRDLNKRGELTHLSIVAVAGGFSASFVAASSYEKASIERDKDPVAAILKAIAGQRTKRRPAKEQDDEPKVKRQRVDYDDDDDAPKLKKFKRKRA